MWILAFSCAFVAGVALGATRDPAWLVILCPAVAFAFMLTVRTRTTIALLVAGTVLFSLLGALRYERSIPIDGPSLVSFYNDSGILQLQAVVSEEPEPGGRYTKVLLDEICVQRDGQLEPVKGRVLVTTADPRPLHYGDEVVFQGELESPEFIDDFDYPRYLALSGVYSTAFCASLEVLPSEDSRSIRARLLSFNSRLGTAMASVLPQPEASLAQSLLLGRRGGLPASVTDAFARTGTAHLLAISGLHLGILVAAILAILLGVLGRRHYLYVWLALLALWTYAFFTGMKPPVVRAAIMASTFLLAELAGRQKHAPTALALAAAIMVGIEPQLLWRTSFQLSVLAMGGLVLLFPPLRALLAHLADRVESRFGLRLTAAGTAMDVVAATLAATVAVWPVCAGTFEQFSLVGVPVSLFTLPALPFALGSASFAGVAALLSPEVAAPFAWLAWLFLTYIVKTVKAFSALPWAAVTVTLGAGGVWFLACYYSLISATPLLWQRLRKRGDREQPRAKHVEDAHKAGWLRWALPPLLLTATLTWSAALSAPDGLLHVTFLDVGQGDAVLVRSPSGRTMLVDGGPGGEDTCTLVDNYLPFWDRSLDVVVATHPHADHLAGLLTVAERYHIGVILQPFVESASLVSQEWNHRLVDSSFTVLPVHEGHQMLLGDGTRVEILNPPAEPLSRTLDDTDNNGVVLRVSYGDVSFLLAADIRAEAERNIVLGQGSGLQSSVLKVAHHGSATSSTGQFLHAVQPRTTVISVGEGNTYGHPDADVLSRIDALGMDVLTTKDTGSVEFVTDGRQLWVSTEA